MDTPIRYGGEHQVPAGLDAGVLGISQDFCGFASAIEFPADQVFRHAGSDRHPDACRSLATRARTRNPNDGRADVGHILRIQLYIVFANQSAILCVRIRLAADDVQRHRAATCKGDGVLIGTAADRHRCGDRRRLNRGELVGREFDLAQRGRNGRVFDVGADVIVNFIEGNR